MSPTLRKSSLSPLGGFHTQVSDPHVPITCNRVEQTLSTQLYSARLNRQEERKDSKDMQDYMACGLLHLQKALLNVRPYIQTFISSQYWFIT